MQDTDISLQSPAKLFGISTALATPFSSDGSIDTETATQHAAWVLEQGAGGVTLFGTTGEGSSLGMHERVELLDAMIHSGIGVEKITTTVCASSLTDAILQAQAFQERGISQMLVTPPFYFNGISDDALFSWFSDFISASQNPNLRTILYHIPQITDVPLSATLVRRLKEAFGEQVLGIKDSSGEWQNTSEFLGIDDLAVLVGDERQLAKAVAAGAAGAICGMANLFPKRMLRLVETSEEDPQITSLVNELVKHPVTAAVKALISTVHQHPGWLRTRTPLQSTPAPVVAELAKQIDSFAIKGLGYNAG
jgi:4-hydroxy-tetrahydrodipicolinate synthase